MSTTPAPTPTATDLERIVAAALPISERPALPSRLSTSLTFTWRALLKIKHVPEQLMDVTVFPVTMMLMFTYLFGGAVAGRRATTCRTCSRASSSCTSPGSACTRATR